MKQQNVGVFFPFFSASEPEGGPVSSIEQQHCLLFRELRHCSNKELLTAQITWAQQGSGRREARISNLGSYLFSFFKDLMLNSLRTQQRWPTERTLPGKDTLVVYQFSARMPKTTEKTDSYTNKEMKKINIKRKIDDKVQSIQGSDSDFMVNVQIK